MKRIITGVIAVICCMNFNCFAEKSEKVILYVEAGAQNGDGSFSSPLGSLQEAKDKVREIKKQGYPKGGITVYFREGTYRITETVDFGSEDSGKDGAPVIYSAYGNENVRFVGGMELEMSDFKEVTDEYGKSAIPEKALSKVKCVNLSDMGIEDVGRLHYYGHSIYYVRQIEGLNLNEKPSPELLFNGTAMTPARYPNDDYAVIDKVISGGTEIQTWLSKSSQEREEIPPVIIKGASERLERWVNAKDPWVYGYWKWDWSDQSMRIADIDVENGTFTTDIPSAYIPLQGQRFYAYNLLEELDAPGEYYIDRDTKILYFYPPENNGTLILTLLEKAFANMNGAENITFKSISMEGSRDNAIYMSKCRNITIEHCVIDKTQGVGIFGESENIGINILSNHIKNTGKSGISLVGGDFAEGKPSENVIKNNWVHNFGRIQKTYCYGIYIRGYAMKVMYNKVHTCPHAAIGFMGNDNLIEYNEIYDALKETDDMGAIYTGRQKICRGNIIRNNYIHDLYSNSENSAGIFGVYLDDTMDGTTVEQNVFENIRGSAVFVNGGRDNFIQNNILINVEKSNFRISAAGVVMGYTLDKLYKDFEGIQDGTYKTEPYKKYTHLENLMEDDPFDPKYNVFNNNISINGGEDIFYDLWGKLESSYVKTRNTINDTYQYKKDPGFVDFERRNYTVSKDSELNSIEGFAAPDFEKIGLLTDWLNYKLDDAVSLKINSPITSKGLDAEYIDEENINVTPIIQDNTTYVPIRYMAETLGGYVEFDDAQRKAYIEVGGKKIVIDLDSKTVYAGNEMLEEVEVIVKNGRTLVPLRSLSEIVSKNVEWHDCGVIIVGDRDVFIDEAEDKELIEELDRRLSI